MKIKLLLSSFICTMTVIVHTAGAGEFKIWSDDIKNGQLAEAQALNMMGCAGGNMSPHLTWAHAPEGTKSFVVTAYDPDAPTGSGFWHWVVMNIPATVTELATGSGSGKAGLPKGAVQTRNDLGVNAFIGACPPPGETHRYIFTVHALKTDHLDLDSQASGALVGFMTTMNRLDKVSVTATYRRPGAP